MTPYAILIDDFLDDFAAVRRFADMAVFNAETNPVDGIHYPDVCLLEDQYNIAKKLGLILGGKATIRLLVMRRSMKGVQVPEQAHTDITVANSMYSMIIYLNREEHCVGGTTLLRHIPSGIEAGDDGNWQKDKNDMSKWEVLIRSKMRRNRAFIHPSHLIHRSEPVGGFGSTPKDARLVMVCLFDLGG